MIFTYSHLIARTVSAEVASAAKDLGADVRGPKRKGEFSVWAKDGKSGTIVEPLVSLLLSSQLRRKELWHLKPLGLEEFWCEPEVVFGKEDLAKTRLVRAFPHGPDDLIPELSDDAERRWGLRTALDSLPDAPISFTAAEGIGVSHLVKDELEQLVGPRNCSFEPMIPLGEDAAFDPAMAPSKPLWFSTPTQVAPWMHPEQAFVAAASGNCGESVEQWSIDEERGGTIVPCARFEVPVPHYQRREFQALEGLHWALTAETIGKHKLVSQRRRDLLMSHELIAFIKRHHSEVSASPICVVD